MSAAPMKEDVITDFHENATYYIRQLQGYQDSDIKRRELMLVSD